MFTQYGIKKDPASAWTNEDYRFLVGELFFSSVLIAANWPLSLKKETIRFIDTLDELRKMLEKGKRNPAQVVLIALEMIESGRVHTLDSDMEAICQSAITVANGCKEDYSGMGQIAKKKELQSLRGTITELFRTRRRRAIESAIKTLGDTASLEDPLSKESIWQQTITVRNGYQKNYSEMSDTAKRAAVRMLERQIAGVLRKRRQAGGAEKKRTSVSL